jgi:hypothetical protein
MEAVLLVDVDELVVCPAVVELVPVETVPLLFDVV